MSLDVNGNDNTPEWGYCRTEGCREEAYPIWKSGDYPDDPDLLLCPKHLGLLIGDLSRQVGEQNTTIGYQDAKLRRAEADQAALLTELEAARAVVKAVQSYMQGETSFVEVIAAYDAARKASGHGL